MREIDKLEEEVRRTKIKWDETYEVGQAAYSVWTKAIKIADNAGAAFCEAESNLKNAKKVLRES